MALASFYLDLLPTREDANNYSIFSTPFEQASAHVLPAGDSGLTLSAPGITSPGPSVIRLYTLGEANYDFWQIDYLNGAWTSWVRSDDPVPQQASLGPVALSRYSGGDSVFVSSAGTIFARYRGPSEGAGWLAVARITRPIAKTARAPPPTRGHVRAQPTGAHRA